MMDKTLIAFSFDDGRLDNYTNAYPILKKEGLPATFNITTGYIKGNIDREQFDFPEPMNQEMVQEIYKDGRYEIAGHGNQHINTVEDIVSGIKELCELLQTERLSKNSNGFASPGSDLTETMYKEMKPILDANHISYIRISCRYNSLAFLKILARKISRFVKLPWLYKIAYKDSLMEEADNDIMYSVPVLSSVTFNQLKAVVAQAIKEKKVFVLMFHSIVPGDSIRNTWDYPKEKFEKFCFFLSEMQKKGELEVVTTMNAYLSLKRGGNLRHTDPTDLPD